MPQKQPKRNLIYFLIQGLIAPLFTLSILIIFFIVKMILTAVQLVVVFVQHRRASKEA